MKKFLAFLAIFSLFFAGCDSQNNAPKSEIEKIKENGKIKIGVFGDKPPFGYIDANGKFAGYDVVFAKRVAKELLGDENKVEFIAVEAANRVEFLQSNKVDLILANFTKTPERAEVVDFALPYMKVSLGVASKNGEISDISQLNGKTLIVNKGTTADIYFTKNHPEINLLKFDQNTETFAAALDGRGDGVSHDNTLLFAWVKEHPEFKVAIGSLGGVDTINPAVKKGNTELLNFINDLIIKLEAEKFFHKAYDEAILPIYGSEINPEDIVVEGGKI